MALDLISVAVAGAAFILAAMTLLLLIESTASFLPATTKPDRPETTPTPRIAVVVPAHNEALGIQETIAAIRRELPESGRLVVVADNCTDRTADLAREAGAEVVERADAQRRGKGYALDFGVRHLASDPPDVVIIIDADCTLGFGALNRIATLAAQLQKPIQASDELLPPSATPGQAMKIAAFAWVVKNFVRPLGMKRLGWPCQLMGTGMAFPWDVIQGAHLGTADIVEDLVLGLQLAAANRAPVFCPDARVTSFFPSTEDARRTQRTRWESGHLSVIRRIVPVYLWRGIRSGNRDLIILAADAAIPPLALLTICIATTLLASGVVSLVGGGTAGLVLAMISMFALLISVLVSVFHAGRILTFKDLASIPWYIASKTFIYLGALQGKRIGWVRSKRD